MAWAKVPHVNMVSKKPLFRSVFNWIQCFKIYQGFYLDAEAACAYLYTRNDIDKSKIILYGQSIGGAVAIHTGIVWRPFTRDLTKSDNRNFFFGLKLSSQNITYSASSSKTRLPLCPTLAKNCSRWYLSSNYFQHLFSKARFVHVRNPLGWNRIHFHFAFKYRNEDKVKLIQVPCCFISGLSDTLVPPKMMHRLYEVLVKIRNSINKKFE